MVKNNKTFVTIIDIQEKLINAVYNKNSITSKIEKLVLASKYLELPILVTEQYTKGLGATIQTVDGNLPKSVFKIEKNSFSACLEEEFSNKIIALKNSGYKHVVICGIETHICVLQTVTDLIEKHGLKVSVVSDASSSRSEVEHNIGLNLMRQRGAEITSLEIQLFELLKSSKHPKFKEVQLLIK